MATTLNALTVEDLGQDATDADLIEFSNYVWEIMDCNPSMSEFDAIAMLWNDGDWIGGAIALGIIDR